MLRDNHHRENERENPTSYQQSDENQINEEQEPEFDLYGTVLNEI